MTLKKFSFLSGLFAFFLHGPIEGSREIKKKHPLINLTFDFMEEKAEIVLNMDLNFEKDLSAVKEKIIAKVHEKKPIDTEENPNFDFQEFSHLFLGFFKIVQDSKKRKHLSIAFVNFINDLILNNFEKKIDFIKDFDIKLFDNFLAENKEETLKCLQFIEEKNKRIINKIEKELLSMELKEKTLSFAVDQMKKIIQELDKFHDGSDEKLGKKKHIKQIKHKIRQLNHWHDITSSFFEKKSLVKDEKDQKLEEEMKFVFEYVIFPEEDSKKKSKIDDTCDK